MLQTPAFMLGAGETENLPVRDGTRFPGGSGPDERVGVHSDEHMATWSSPTGSYKGCPIKVPIGRGLGRNQPGDHVRKVLV